MAGHRELMTAGLLLLLLHPFGPAAATEVNLDSGQDGTPGFVTDPQPSPPDAGETTTHTHTRGRAPTNNAGAVHPSGPRALPLGRRGLAVGLQHGRAQTQSPGPRAYGAGFALSQPRARQSRVHHLH